MSFVTEKVFAMSPGKVPDEECQNLVGIDENAVAVDSADAVPIPVGAETGVVLAGSHGLTQRFDVRLDRFRMHAAETRIARAADFVAGNSVAFEKLGQ